MFIGTYSDKLDVVARESYPNSTPIRYENKYPMHREMQVYHKIAEMHRHSEGEGNEAYCGLIAQSFTMKTGLTDAEVIKTIRENPGHDIYVFSPFQYEQLVWKGFFDQAFIFHDGLISLARRSLLRADILNEAVLLCKEYPWVFCNFWVAKEQLFRKLTRDMMTVFDKMIEDPLGKRVESGYKSFSEPAEGAVREGYILLPFAMERITSYLISNAERSGHQVYRYIDTRPIECQMNCLTPELKKAYEIVISKKRRKLVLAAAEPYAEVFFTDEVVRLIESHLKRGGLRRRLGFLAKQMGQQM